MCSNLTKFLSLKLIKTKTLMLGTACMVAFGASAASMDFQFQFYNTGGNVGLPTDLITGTIHGLNEGANFQQITVTIDSIIPTADPAFTIPTSWYEYVTATVTAGSLTSVAFSANQGGYAISVTSSYFSLGDFSKYYLGSPVFSPSPSGPGVPDGGVTVGLLGLSLFGLGLVHRKLAS